MVQGRYIQSMVHGLVHTEFGTWGSAYRLWYMGRYIQSIVHGVVHTECGALGGANRVS